MKYLRAGYRWMPAAVICFTSLYGIFVWDARRETPEERRFRRLDFWSWREKTLKQRPTFREEDNGAIPILRAMALLAQSENPMRAEPPFAGTPGLNWDQDLTTAQMNALHAYVSQNQESLDLILEAQRRPFYRLPKDHYDSLRRSWLPGLRELAGLLSCAIVDAALSGKQERFEELTVAGLRFHEQVDAVLHTDELLAMDIAYDAIVTLEYGLRHIVPRPEVVRLWMELLAQERYVSCSREGRIFDNDSFSLLLYANNDISVYERFYDRGDLPTLVWHWRRMLWQREWSQVTYFCESLALMQRQGNALDEMKAASLRFYLDNELLPFYASTYGTSEELTKQAAAARTALAAWLYREDHGRLPERLEDLMPDYLEELPQESVARNKFVQMEPLQYRIHNDHAVFYGVGRNGWDYGGRKSKRRYDSWRTGTVFYLPAKGQRQ